MAQNSKASFEKKLNLFNNSFLGKTSKRPPRLALIVMGNTLDKTLSAACKTDLKNVRTSFKKIAAHLGYLFTDIEISNKDYSWENVLKALDQIPRWPQRFIGNHDDVIIFYYTGHGFSYQKDRHSKYPQLDMRPHNNKTDPNHIDFIRNNTKNIGDVLGILGLRGKKINIAIADCCNTTIPFKRPVDDAVRVGLSFGVLPPKLKKLTKASYTHDDFEVSILVASSQLGQPSIANAKQGSIFTNTLMESLNTLLDKPAKGDAFIPWVDVLKKASSSAFKQSKGFDIGGGVAGKQKAVFQVYGEDLSYLDAFR